MDIVVRTATVVEAGSSTAGTVTSIAGSLPGDQQAGDFVIAALSVTAAANPTIPTPSGWTQLFTAINATTGEFFTAYSALAPGSPPTFTPSAAVNRATVEIQAFGGVDTTTPWDVAIQTTSSAATTTLVATGVTTVTPGAMLVSAATLQTSSRALNAPSGMTQDVTYAQAGGRALTVAHELRPTIGATGTRTWTWDATSLAAAAFVGALRPAPDASHVVDATQAAAREALRRRTSRPTSATLIVRPTAVPSTTDVTITSTFGVTADATRTAFADVAEISTGLTVTADASVSSRLFTAETLEVEFTPAVWTDVTADWIAPLIIRQGRPTPFDEVAGGSLETRLHNIDGRYMTGLKGKRIRWRITKGEDTFTRFVGWIQSAKASFPSGELRKGVVGIVAVDALGLLEQRKLRSNLTELSLWRARTDACAVDAYEASATTSSSLCYMTNYSTDTFARQGQAFGIVGDTPLEFGTDNDLSAGAIVTAPSTQTFVTAPKFQANPLQIILHYKGPASQVAIAGQIYVLASFENSSAAWAFHLAITQSGTSNSLVLRNAANTATLATLGTIPFGDWVQIVAMSNATTPALSDWAAYLSFGTTLGSASAVAVDVRTIGANSGGAGGLWLPGNSSPSAPGSWGGIVALGTRTTVPIAESFTGAINGTVSTRVDSIENVAQHLPISITKVGTLTTSVATGRWDGRSAAAVLREVLRTTSGIAWARSRDSEVIALGADELYPDTAVVALDVDEDCVGPPTFVDASDTTPTRVDVAYPGGIVTAADAVVEARGETRSTRTTTVATTPADALAAGQAMLSRATTGIRISQITLDLNGAVHDPTAALFDETTVKGGLYPTQRIRVQVPPWYFGVSHYDVHVEGWSEVYEANNEVRLQLDTSPAIDQPLPVAQQFGAVRGQPTAVTAARARRAVNTSRPIITRNRS